MPGAFYECDGDRWIPSELTRGPWDPKAQHAGPPSALIAREIENLGDGRIGGDGPEAQVGRITYEIVRPVPIAPLTLEAEVARPGRSVEMVEAELSGDEGVVVRARGWRLRLKDVELAPEPPPDPEPPPGPEQGTPAEFFATGQDVGYHTAMEYQFVEGAFLEPGPATVWMRMRHPLVAGEEPTPLQRVMVAADTGNGVSAALDWERFLFINVDLSVHLARMPEGEWVCLKPATHPQPNGVGLTETALYDQRGPIGRANQTLLVDRR